ncbi:MAG: DUF2075 domain-containing protein [Endomicrobium sp.]|jgi:uncharacterized protein with HEPN domain|nr:DUF2075 domain-containing protein [Endomicrobium sp.]
MTTINQLDPSQKNVLRQLTCPSQDKASNISIVYGPPGTGKSHLIVSLLFELVIKKKKVLFVSQNTEALKVIERMINRLERELFDIKEKDLFDNNISLTDFCLMLNDSKCRTKKYIKESYNRLSSKIFPPFNENNLPNASRYDLTYVNLDREANYNIDISQELGFDELLFNYLKNVKTDNIPSVPVKYLEQINLRKIFSRFNSYSDTANLFSDNNNPSNALRFFSKTNFDSTLPKIHSTVDEIINLFSESGIEKLTYPILKENSIINILSAYKKISEINALVNIKQIQDDNIAIDDIDDLFKQCETAIEISDKIENVDSIKSLGLIKDEILKELDISLLDNRETIEKCNTDIKKALIATNELIKTDLKESEIENALSLCVETIDSSDSSLFRQTELIEKYKNTSTQTLKELFKVITERNNKNFLYKMFTSGPNILDKYGISSIKKFNSNDKPFLEKMVSILQKTDYAINYVLQFCGKKSAAAYIPLQNYTLEQKIDILNKILIVYEISARYKISNIDYLSIDSLNEIFKKLDTDFTNYNDVVSKNIALAVRYPQLITLINANIRNIKNNDILLPIIKKYAKYLYSEENREDFICQARKIKYKEELLTIVNALDITSPIPEIEESKINKITNILEQTKLFSNDFFSMNSKESVRDWIERIKNIINFSDRNAFDSFLNQNKFLHAIREELGENKKQLIDKFLENNTITYKDFIKKITNDLVKAKLHNIDSDIRKNINDDYFVEYKKNLKTERKNYFLNGLQDVSKYTRSAREKVKSDSNWTPGKTPIDSLQQNTKLIINAFPIVIATPKEVAKYILAQKELFDFIIFDEASQLLPGQALPCIYRAKEAIVIGDPHQMPPPLLATIGYDGSKTANDDEDSSNEKSILDLAIELQTQSQYYLQVHYRSENNMLFDPSTTAIYKEYEVHSIFESGSNTKVPISIQDNLGNNDEKNFDIIVKEVKDVLAKNPEASFCLLFTNKETLSKFEDYAAIKNAFSKFHEGQILISTVTNCQGIENDHSIIYLNHYNNIGAMWFFKKSAGAYKRLNVSITRQRKSLKIFMANPKSDWLLTCSTIISDSYEDKDRIKSAQLLQSVIEKSNYDVNEQYIDDLLKDNELRIDSPLTEELYNRLRSHYRERLNKDIKIYCEVGWLMRVPDKTSLQRHVGFRLDIGIYSPNKKYFVLGIEMDGAMYHKGSKRAFVDAQRQKTLETKGWKVYRIWSTNWLNNIDDEFKKLTDKINELL